MKPLEKDSSIRRLGFEGKTALHLEAAGIRTIGSLQEKSVEDLWNTKGIGPIMVAEILRKSKIYNLGIEKKPLVLKEDCSTFPSSLSLKAAAVQVKFLNMPYTRLKGLRIRKFGQLVGYDDNLLVTYLGEAGTIYVLEMLKYFGLSCGKEALLEKLRASGRKEEEKKEKVPQRTEELRECSSGVQSLSWVLISNRRAEKELVKIAGEKLPKEIKDCFSSINRNIGDILEWFEGYMKKI